ncbi:hypothetical protein ACFLXV_02290 [Chloroflexota bacterium]
MNDTEFKIDKHSRKEIEWADGWATMANPGRFATKFNSTLPGAYRQVTEDDIRQMAQYGLIGRCGFFDRSDQETVRGLLQYEQFRERATEREMELELVHSA